VGDLVVPFSFLSHVDGMKEDYEINENNEINEKV